MIGKMDRQKAKSTFNVYVCHHGSSSHILGNCNGIIYSDVAQGAKLFGNTYHCSHCGLVDEIGLQSGHLFD